MNSHLSIEQQQQLQDVGASLRQLRQARKLSVSQISGDTMIPPRLLVALETADLAELPEPFYIEALVTKYAAALKASEIQLPSGFSSFKSTETLSKNTTLANQRHSDQRHHWLNFQLRSLHLYLLYILLVIVSVSGISFLLERPIIVQPPIPNPQEARKVDPNNSATLTTTPTNLAATSPQLISQSSSTEQVSVGIDLQEDCWLKVMVDGKVAFEGILAKGTQKQWTGQKEVTLRAGNAGGVVISFNNQQQKVLGAPGEVEEITYTLN